MEKVSPVLAEIIGHIDTNHNLDILFEGSEWKKDFWLKYFKTRDAVNLKVSAVSFVNFHDFLMCALRHLLLFYLVKTLIWAIF